MANFVLIHGAWGGGHTFNRTAADLRADGHSVQVVALRGLGARRNELSPAITLSDHVADAMQQIDEAGFERFVLAGHSYGGMIITQLSALLGARIDALCYIDAFLPADGQSLWDITGDYEHHWYIDSQKRTPGLVAPIGDVQFEDSDSGKGRHPLLTLVEAVQLGGDESLIPRRAYILATRWQPTPFPRFAEQVRQDDAWEYHEVDATHMVMTDQPAQLLSILTGLVGQRADNCRLGSQSDE